VSKDDQPPTSIDVADLMQRSANTTATLRFPTWFIALTCVAATALGAAYDVPTRSWGPGWFVRQAIVITVLVVWVYGSRRAWQGARLRPAIFGRALIVAFFAGVALLYVATTALSLGLREAGVPLPSTLAGLAAGVTLVVVIRRLASRINTRYRQRVKDGNW
jgi:hypothetical protein